MKERSWKNINGRKEEKIMITSKYDWWLNEKKKRKSDLNFTIYNNWPRKTRNHDYNFDKIGARQPRFERW